MPQATKKYSQVALVMGTRHSQKDFHSADLNPGPLAHHGQRPRKIKCVADCFTKWPTKSEDFGKIHFPQTCTSFLGITSFILFDPQTPLLSWIQNIGGPT